MGCCHTRQAVVNPVTAIHVPFGHVPYTPSLPGVMGPQSHYQMEWWFYGGWATDTANSRKFSIILWSHRALGVTAVGESIGGMFYGIGVKSISSDSETAFFTKTERIGLGQFPVPTATNWHTHVEAGLGTTSMHCKLISGTLALRGATYQVDVYDRHENIQVCLKLEA